MKHDSFDVIELILKYWKTILAILVFFGIGGGLGSYGYLDVNEKPSKPVVSHIQPEIKVKPCICQCGITKHLKRDHQIY